MDPFLGADAGGNVFPGPSLLFGSIKPGPVDMEHAGGDFEIALLAREVNRQPITASILCVRITASDFGIATSAKAAFRGFIRRATAMEAGWSVGSYGRAAVGRQPLL